MSGTAPTARVLSSVTAAPKPAVLLVALVLVASIGWFDAATGWRWDASVFYALPIVLVVWRTDWRLGSAFAVLCSAAWSLAQLGNHPYRTGGEFVLAISSVSFYFLVIVVAVAAVKAQWVLGRGRIAMLERAQELEREILRASEQEQQRIGRDLHDGLCQTLAGIAALASTLSRRLGKSAESDASAAAGEIARLLNGAIAEARDLARGLVPMGPQGADLRGALEDLALNVHRRFGVACGVDFADSFPRLHREIEGHLFRITQEAVNNAVTHGRADRIGISLDRSEGAGLLRVRDDGVGIAEAEAHGAGMGLGTMAYRAGLIGGSLDVRPFAPRGTIVTCRFALPATAVARDNVDDA